MKAKNKPNSKIVLLCIIVCLCVLGAAFCLLFGNRLERAFWQAEQAAKEKGAHLANNAVEKAGDKKGDNTGDNISPAEQEFLEKNQEEIKALHQTATQLEELLPELGVTSRRFNEGLVPLIDLLEQMGEQLTLEHWAELQTQFAYEYDKLNRLRQEQTNLPKPIAESEDKIMQILQELNQQIQRMNK